MLRTLHDHDCSFRKLDWFATQFRTAGMLVILMATCAVQAKAADQWPGFRGLDLNATVPAAKMPASLNRDAAKWTYDLKQYDVGSMAIQDGTIYTLASASDGQAVRLIALDLQTGTQKWEQTLPQAKNHLHSRNTPASSTPATDADFVYVAHSDREHTWVRCFDHQGNLIWKRDLGLAQSQHGFGTSPTVHGDVVLLNFSQQAEQLREGKPGTSKFIALQRSTGKTQWETPLASTRVCYGLPVVRDGVVYGANTGNGIFALSLETGKLLWDLPVFSKRCVSTAMIADDLVMGTSGSGGGGNHLVAVRVPKNANEQPTEVYRIERGAPYVPTSIIHQGLLFMIDDRGIASCYKAKSGDELWKQRIGGSFGASPVLLGNQLLMINLSGEATVVEASEQGKVVQKIDLGGPVGATPAYADGLLLLRVGSELRCHQ